MLVRQLVRRALQLAGRLAQLELVAQRQVLQAEALLRAQAVKSLALARVCQMARLELVQLEEMPVLQGLVLVCRMVTQLVQLVPLVRCIQ